MTDAEKRRRLQAALDRAGPMHAMPDLLERLADGRAQWWANRNGMVVTEVTPYPLVTACDYWLVAGDLQDCLAMQPDIDDWARERGCQVALCNGRRGWSKILPQHGWTLYGVSYSKTLTPSAEGFGRVQRF